MFRALQAAMLADPAPMIQSRAETHRVGDMSHTIVTGGASGATTEGSAALQAQIDAVSASADAATAGEALAAAAEAKKRGRKSNAEREAAAAAKAAEDAAKAENALRPGDALKGVSAQSLAAALEGMPLVMEAGGTQLRAEPGTPPDEVAAIRARVEAQVALDKAAEAKKAAATKGAATGGMDDDLASLFRKKETEEPTPPQVTGASRFAALTGPALMKEFMAYINGDGGLFWARNVLKHFNLEMLDDLTEPQIRDALENPSQFAPSAA
jgi:hypothetical protein